MNIIAAVDKNWCGFSTEDHSENSPTSFVPSRQLSRLLSRGKISDPSESVPEAHYFFQLPNFYLLPVSYTHLKQFRTSTHIFIH